MGKEKPNKRIWDNFKVTLNIEKHTNIVRSVIYFVQDHNCKQGIEKIITKPNQVYIVIG